MLAFVRLVRPKQWIKNIFVLAPIFFARLYRDEAAWELIGPAFFAFLFSACSIYIINDIKDAKEDAFHPVKSRRPIAAGHIKRMQAITLLAVFIGLNAAVWMVLPPACIIIILTYIGLNLFYSFYLKHVAILDVFCVASCYVLRILMGCNALAVSASPWIILTTFLLALFLVFGKRYHEISIENYAQKKRNLSHYSKELLANLLVISGGAALMAYAIYTVETAKEMGAENLIYTVVFVAFGLFRYLQSVMVLSYGGEPEMVILKDRLQLINLVLWFVTILAVAY